ncbi:hypothetical protein [Pseudomonas sp. NPDC087336]|jgi:hypothetical protein|uniref:hypothetical protein n=1 Tax=Pseudomonas sp. NPDC087336 TaxID=3364436 RepID=UPI003822F8D9
MSSESTFQGNKQDPKDPGKYDPLTQPDLEEDEDARDWSERDRKLPEADEQTPLSDDRR